VAWARYDNATGTTDPVGQPQTITERRVQAPAAVLTSEFVQATLTGDHPTHPGWATPTSVVFRRMGSGWKLVGVDRMALE
jgi:hypothetical protein